MKTQTKAFWSIYLSFCATATLFLYLQGAFVDMSTIAKLMLVVVYLIVGALTRLYVKSNAEQIQKWFEQESDGEK